LSRTLWTTPYTIENFWHRGQVLRGTHNLIPPASNCNTHAVGAGTDGSTLVCTDFPDMSPPGSEHKDVALLDDSNAAVAAQRPRLRFGLNSFLSRNLVSFRKSHPAARISI
jgi:hypothetical protein